MLLAGNAKYLPNSLGCGGGTKALNGIVSEGLKSSVQERVV